MDINGNYTHNSEERFVNSKFNEVNYWKPINMNIDEEIKKFVENNEAYSPGELIEAEFIDASESEESNGSNGSLSPTVGLRDIDFLRSGHELSHLETSAPTRVNHHGSCSAAAAARQSLWDFSSFAGPQLHHDLNASTFITPTQTVLQQPKPEPVLSSSFGNSSQQDPLNMGNRASQAGDKKGKHASAEVADPALAKVKSEPKSSPGLFRRKEKDDSKKAGRGKNAAPKILPIKTDVKEKPPSKKYEAPLRPTVLEPRQELSPSPESSISSSVYHEAASTFQNSETHNNVSSMEDSATLKDVCAVSLNDISVACDSATNSSYLTLTEVEQERDDNSSETNTEAEHKIKQARHDAEEHMESISGQITDDEDTLMESYDEVRPITGSMPTTPLTPSAFSISSHRRIILEPNKFNTVQSGRSQNELRGSEESIMNKSTCSMGTGSNATSPVNDCNIRRYLSYSDVPPLGQLEGNVMRKVASLTLDKATLEAKINKPKFVPEKLDFKLYEKFEGESIFIFYGRISFDC